MTNNTPRIGTNLNRRIEGRLRVLEKNMADIQKRPAILAAHYFALGLLYRDNRQYHEAHDAFKRALHSKFALRHLLHYASMMMGGFFYDFFIR